MGKPRTFIAFPYEFSSSVCLAVSVSTRSASKRHLSASAAALSPSFWKLISISSAMCARLLPAASSVCSRDILRIKCIASTALCSSIARIRSSSFSSCVAEASCAAHSAKSTISRCLNVVCVLRDSFWYKRRFSSYVPLSFSSSRRRCRKNSFSLACSRAFLATASTSRVRAALPRIPGLHTEIVRP